MHYILFPVLIHGVNFPNIFNEFLGKVSFATLAASSPQIFGNVHINAFPPPPNSIPAQSSAQKSPLVYCMNTRDKTYKVVRMIYCQLRVMDASCSLHTFLVFVRFNRFLCLQEVVRGQFY